MPDYKEIINKLFSDNIDQESFNIFKTDLSARISKNLSFYKIKFKLTDTSQALVESYTEDLVQEIFYIILTSKDFFSQIQHLDNEQYTKVCSKWLNTTIRNTTINFLKGKGILNRTDLSSVYSEEQDYFIQAYDDPTEDFVTELISTCCIEEFFASLDDDEKKVVRLKLLDRDLKQKGIAKELNFSEAKVSRIFERIKEKYYKNKK